MDLAHETARNLIKNLFYLSNTDNTLLLQSGKSN